MEENKKEKQGNNNSYNLLRTYDAFKSKLSVVCVFFH